MIIRTNTSLCRNNLSSYVLEWNIRESVDSLCRDGADTPISLNIQNCSKLPNTADKSLLDT